ncbi:hypothetical protein AU106_gp229 [Sinorhizobium phage phiM9]|uniref:Uncharacterized protein n=1 Tax=Sinorhizobium phage phiM9 TaxID=1636182 RepID=A0A0F6R633_9CAUD|nr:hypothetical protein AU106_gp229 [Sinorhizobium phage phiM9]AKE44860.1 hypothetical protein Sm_phiM9_233 [Sinorhizobium phage phiM9]
MTEQTYTSIDHTEGCDLVVCAHCEYLQYERPHPLNKGGKYAWLCRSCGTANEGDKVHLLENTARFRPRNGLSGP